MCDEVLLGIVIMFPLILNVSTPYPCLPPDAYSQNLPLFTFSLKGISCLQVTGYKKRKKHAPSDF